MLSSLLPLWGWVGGCEEVLWKKPGNKTSFRSEMSLETIVECLRVINGWQSLNRGEEGGVRMRMLLAKRAVVGVCEGGGG